MFTWSKVKQEEATAGMGADWPAPPAGVEEEEKQVLGWLRPLPCQRRVNAAYERGPRRRDRVEFDALVLASVRTTPSMTGAEACPVKKVSSHVDPPPP